MATPEVSTQPSPAQLLRWFYEWSHPLRPRRKTRAERLAIYRVRSVVFERSNGFCETGVSPKCLRSITWGTMHTAHIVSRARGGTWEPETCWLRASSVTSTGNTRAASPALRNRGAYETENWSVSIRFDCPLSQVRCWSDPLVQRVRQVCSAAL